MKKLFFVFACLFLSIPCQARIITVDDDEAADFNNIQAAINDSNDGDTIIVADGTYTGNGNRDIDFLGKAITVRSTDPNDSAVVGATVIDCQSRPIPGQTYTGFFFDSGEDSNTVLEGLTITGGFSVNVGGGIYCGNSSPTIRNCIIRGNVGYSGGGIDCTSSSPTVTNCVIKDNNSLAYGGGIACFYGGDLQITNCTITGNSAFASGDGIYCFDSSPTITNCILWGNTPEEVYVYSGTPVVTYSDVQGGWPGLGNIDSDPCFADANNGDYHLNSKVGHWDPNTQSWVQDNVHSPCIDKGDPALDWTRELWPHGKRVNMGAYGGTPEASMSQLDIGNIANLDNDVNDIVNSLDLALFVGKWCYEEFLLAEDLNRDGFVNFNDFALFGLQWSYPSASEPSMTFQIDDCNMEEGQSRPVVAESNEPRFSLWVEGRYIHFEDQMYANCCPDELGLDKEINGNEITLYEIGYGGLCDCMCYFPITATLGPFEDGTYTVEVYDNYGNSLGVVEVTIGGSPEPGITFRIDECDLFSQAEQSSQARFSVTVDGLYIHFEDTMTANCCPDGLGLEMVVEDNLITIYETEYTPGGCRCWCNYPITATLGPFEPGVYTLDVYEDHSGFIGSTTVVIDPPE